MDLLSQIRLVNYSKEEYAHLFYFAIISGFLFSFNDWGTKTFSLSVGLKNLSTAIAVAFFITLITTWIVKFFGIKKGVFVRFKLNYILSALAFLLTYLSFGYIPSIAFFDMKFEYDEKIRFGRPKLMPNLSEYSSLSSQFLFWNILVSLFAFMFVHSKYFFQLSLLQLYYLIPIPYIPGYYSFMAGKESFTKFVKTYSFILLTLLILFVFYLIRLS